MKYRRPLVAVTIAAAAALTAHALTHLQLFDALFGEAERKTEDYRVRSAARAHGDSAGIALVLFDSSAVQSWPYLEPFPRAALADLVRTAAANGAAVIGLDVYLDRRYDVLSRLDDGDTQLRDAIRDAGNVVLVAPTEQRGAARHVLPVDPFFAEVAAAVAAADLPTPYETTRAATLVTMTQGGAVPGFALALYATLRGLDLDSLMQAIVTAGRVEVADVPARYAAVERAGATSLPLRFVGPPSRTDREDGAFPAYPSSVLATVGGASGFTANEALESWLRGKAVLLGSGFHDSERFRTPFYDHVFTDGELAGWTYGVEVHATALQNLLTREYLRPAPRAAALAVLLLVALVAAGVTFRRGAKLGAAAAAAAFLAAAWLALEAFDRTGTTLPVFGSALAALLAYTGAAAYVSIIEGREKRMIRGAFSKYVPAGVVDDLVADPSRLKLGGEKRTISILFSDVAGFTSLSEVLPPETLVSILNEYLDEMSDIVFDERGTLDKYIGDAIMALWGAPAAVPDHAARACRAAIRMQRRLDEWNAEWHARRAEDWTPLRIRVGINTGTPVVGNIGGEKRFDYTALGDAVNLAARLEPACKGYGVSIMIAEATRVGAGDEIVVRELDMLAVYGRTEPVRVYELLGMRGDAIEPALAEALQHYEDGLAAYRRRDFELALSYFDAVLELRPEDGPARLYRERSADHITHPPPADWDFVERRRVK